MSCHLSKDLKSKHDKRSIPVRKGDHVKIVRGSLKNRDGKVITVYRRRWCIHVDKVTKEKANGTPVAIPIHPSNCIITQLKIDKNRKQILEKNKERKAKGKGKHSQDGINKMDWAMRAPLLATLS